MIDSTTYEFLINFSSILNMFSFFVRDVQDAESYGYSESAIKKWCIAQFCINFFFLFEMLSLFVIIGTTRAHLSRRLLQELHGLLARAH